MLFYVLFSNLRLNLFFGWNPSCIFILFRVDLDEVLPVNYHSDNTSETNIKQIDEDVRRMNLTENQKSHPNHTPPSLTSSDERTSHSPLRGEHFRQLSTQPVRYSFADSEDEENEDPIAWALASRSGIY